MDSPAHVEQDHINAQSQNWLRVCVLSGLDGDKTKGLALNSVWTLKPDFPDRNAGSATYREMLNILLNLCVHQ